MGDLKRHYEYKESLLTGVREYPSIVQLKDPRLRNRLVLPEWDEKTQVSQVIQKYGISNFGRRIVKFLLFMRRHKISLEDIKQSPLYIKPHTLPYSKQFFSLIKLSEHSKVKKMLEVNKMYVFQIDSVGKSPVHWAVLRGDELMVRLLIRHYADLENKDWSGRTPMSYAVMGGNPSIVSVRLIFLF